MHFLEYSLDFICNYNATFQSNLSIFPSLKAKVLRPLHVLPGKYLISETIAMTQQDLISVNRSDSSLQLPDNEDWKLDMKPGDICQKKRITLIQIHLQSFSVMSESPTRL